MTKSDEIMKKLFSIIVAKNTHGNKDIYHLYELLKNTELFVKIITLFDGRRINFPKKEEVTEAMLLAIIYYYREYEGKDWQEIKQLVPYDFSAMEYSLKLRNLNNDMKKQLKEALHEPI